jgi:2,4-dienoyl-CoA reductase-like NADH-dependent reductase (Old Yellow Enzyme family)
MKKYRPVAQLKTDNDFRTYLADIGANILFDEQLISGDASPLRQSYQASGFNIGNRFAILPMEGWDGTRDGRPSELTIRRWQHFGASGAKLIWGGEAVAVRPDGKANPNQLMLNKKNLADFVTLREALVQAHAERYGKTEDLIVGLQLTHSGRFAKPSSNTRLEPRILYRHPILDRKFGITGDGALLSDDEIGRLIIDFIQTARLAQTAGFDFVDIKHCHGYLGHEFLSATRRPGRYGGSFENRTRFLREIVAGICSEAPSIKIGVRLSAFDWIAFGPGEDCSGRPEAYESGRYPFAFGGDGSGTGIDLTEPFQFLDLLRDLGIHLVCITAGSPYYNPHIQRPALFPPSDGYLPPEDPLLGVARQITVTAQLKKHRPELAFVGSGYSYLQEWLPNVAQYVIRSGMVDFIGLGRMILSYPDFPADVLEGKLLKRKLLCRTFSDCTTAPRNGLISGCYALDEFYKKRPEATSLAEIKRKLTVKS